jgi:hypothetical protein
VANVEGEIGVEENGEVATNGVTNGGVAIGIVASGKGTNVAGAIDGEENVGGEIMEWQMFEGK